MKVSLNWLKHYIDIEDVPVKEICDKMVLAGFEVEELICQGESMTNVIVGKVEKMERHPDSDHLWICQINVGGEENVQIVTGAQNVFEGALVPAALHDSHLPNGMHIKKGKLRGVASNGMLCSGEELCIGENDYVGASVNGILILKEDDSAIGKEMTEILGLDDYIIDFGITANRPDCQSVLGIAREVAVVLGKELKMPTCEFTEAGDDINNYISVEVKNYDLCPRYYGRIVKNVKIAESPEWMKKCLLAAGMRPISNIVDITNFVMLETGMPMHAFDLRDITSQKIIVRNAVDGEKIVTLDEKEHTLTEDMLVIADGEKPSCLAGIMGSLNSEIKDDTTAIFFECAKFRRDSIRKTGRKLGIRTEASGRFEHGVDIMNVEYAMNRCLQLISDLGVAEIVSGHIDRHEALPEDRELIVSEKAICDLLGAEIPEEAMLSILNSLQIKTTAKDGILRCLVPSFRDDIEGMADIAEECIRIYGYDHLVAEDMRGSIVRGRRLPERLKTDKLKRAMIAEGMREITTYSFISGKAIDLLGLDESDSRKTAIKILNPLGEEYSTMRTQLLTSMLTVLSTNYNRKMSAVRFFEVSKVFIPKSLPLTEAPLELPAMSIGMYGDEVDFFELKGIVETVIGLFAKNISYDRASENYLHPGRSAVATVNGRIKVATFGELHPDVAEKIGIDKRVYVAEIALYELFALPEGKTVYKPLPKYPAVERDFALVCDKELPVAVLEKAIKNGASNLCEKITLFDVYTGEQVGVGKKSVAYRVSLRSPDATLTDEIVDSAVSKIMKQLENAGAVLRS